MSHFQSRTERNSLFYCSHLALGLVLVFGLVLALTAGMGMVQAANTEWRAFNGGYSADRYSPLQQITPQNVNSLRQVGTYQLPETTSFPGGSSDGGEDYLRHNRDCDICGGCA